MTREEAQQKYDYGMGNCPFPVPPTEFKYNTEDLASNLSIEFGVGKDAYKDECESFIDVNADMGGAYGLNIGLKIGGQWYSAEECQAVRVVIRGQYEKNCLIEALRKTGLMANLFYGKMELTPEEEQNAIREQTKTV